MDQVTTVGMVEGVGDQVCDRERLRVGPSVAGEEMAVDVTAGQPRPAGVDAELQDSGQAGMDDTPCIARARWANCDGASGVRVSIARIRKTSRRGGAEWSAMNTWPRASARMGATSR